MVVVLHLAMVVDEASPSCFDWRLLFDILAKGLRHGRRPLGMEVCFIVERVRLLGGPSVGVLFGWEPVRGKAMTCAMVENKQKNDPVLNARHQGIKTGSKKFEELPSDLYPPDPH
eukprot:1150613-Pelagomonas_calceolata.AAC.2